MSNYIYSQQENANKSLSEKFSMSKIVDAKKDERSDSAAHEDVRERYRRAGYKIDQNTKGEERYTKGDVIFIDRKDKIEFPDSQDKERLKTLIKERFDLTAFKHGTDLNVSGSQVFHDAVNEAVADINQSQGRISRNAFEQEPTRVPSEIMRQLKKADREDLMKSYVNEGMNIKFVGPDAEKLNARMDAIKQEHNSSTSAGMD